MWNENVWTESKIELRQNIIKGVNPDILCLSVTHLPIAENISVSGFTWIDNNRKFVNLCAPKPSGRIGILSNQCLRATYDINILNKQHVGSLAVEFKDKYTDFSVVVITRYLSPGNSVWGRNASSFFVNLLSLVYTCSFADIIIICVDFKARIGCTLDFIPDIDNVNFRLVIDQIHVVGPLQNS